MGNSITRSHINELIAEFELFLAHRQFELPVWAHWTLDDWNIHETSNLKGILEPKLGWDITDFGSGDIDCIGLSLFTIRNGVLGMLGTKVYAEKIMMVKENQVTPSHHHKQKMEDIINRGGGNLIIRLWNVGPDESSLDESTSVQVAIDGLLLEVEAGGTITLNPGESVCLKQTHYHRFWGEEGEGSVLVGEVSMVNDDINDNFWIDAPGRFPVITEDEAPLRLLVGDYKRFLT